MIEDKNWDVVKMLIDQWNNLPFEERSKYNKFLTMMQLQTLIQVKECYKEDMSPNLKRKLTKWENDIVDSIKREDKLTLEQIKQFPMTSYSRMLGKELTTQVMNELFWYKAIEKELGGISLIDKSVYVQAYKHIVEGKIISINFDDKSFLVEIGEIGIPHDIGLYFVSEKGKTWALTREELE